MVIAVAKTFGKYVSVVALVSIIAACQAEIAVTGGTPMPGLEPTPEEQAEREARAAEEREREAAEAESRQIALLRATTINALSAALSDLVHDCAPGSMSDPNGSTRTMARRVADTRDRMSTAPDSEVRTVHAEARDTLDAAYIEAVNCGAIYPSTYGPQNADETWWYISSP